MASCPLSPPTVPSIPPVIHMIWLGSPPPAYVSTMRDSWVQHHPGMQRHLQVHANGELSI
jgi:mannosyltransferase OCH1-like enzyme